MTLVTQDTAGASDTYRSPGCMWEAGAWTCALAALGCSCAAMVQKAASWWSAACTRTAQFYRGVISKLWFLKCEEVWALQSSVGGGYKEK